MKTPDIFDLYTDYLITSFSYTTATGLSGLVDNAMQVDLAPHFYLPSLKHLQQKPNPLLFGTDFGYTHINSYNLCHASQ
jgi:hypothetical protein